MKCCLLLCVVVHLVGMAPCDAAGHGGVIGRWAGSRASRAGGARRATRGVWGAQPGQAIGRISSSAAGDRFQCDGCCGGALSSDGALAAPAASRRDELAAGGRGCVLQQAERSRGFVAGAMGRQQRGRGFSRTRACFRERTWERPAGCIMDQTSLMIAGGRHRHPSAQTPLCRAIVAMSTRAAIRIRRDAARRIWDGPPFWGGVVISQGRTLLRRSFPGGRVDRRTCRIKPPEIVMGWGCTSQNGCKPAGVVAVLLHAAASARRLESAKESSAPASCGGKVKFRCDEEL